MKKIFLAVFGLVLFGGVSFASRIDSVLYCDISDESISVHLTETNARCDDYLQRLSQVESELNYSIRVVQGYLDGGKNTFYRRGLLADLVLRQQKTAAMTNRINLAINNYKIYLYAVIKPKVLTLLDHEQARCAGSWSRVSPQLGCRLGQDGLLKRIAASEDIDGLLKLLLEYNSMKRNYGYG